MQGKRNLSPHFRKERQVIQRFEGKERVRTDFPPTEESALSWYTPFLMLLCTGVFTYVITQALIIIFQ